MHIINHVNGFVIPVSISCFQFFFLCVKTNNICSIFVHGWMHLKINENSGLLRRSKQFYQLYPIIGVTNSKEYWYITSWNNIILDNSTWTIGCSNTHTTSQRSEIVTYRLSASLEFLKFENRKVVIVQRRDPLLRYLR